jgi:hypothetical protein
MKVGTLYTYVHGSTIHNSPKVDTPTVNEWINKTCTLLGTAAHAYNPSYLGS